MSNEIREKDHEWVKAFHSNFDRLLVLLEKLLEKRQPSAYGDELLTDKEVAYLLKVSRRTLQDYRNNGILPYTQVGGKILYRASDIEKTLMKEGGIQIQKELTSQASPTKNTQGF